MQDALHDHDFDEIDRILSGSFFRLLVEDFGLLGSVFSVLPGSWYERYPRHFISRAMFDAAGASKLILRPELVAAFAKWVDGQAEAPASDLLVLRLVRVLELLGRGWYQDALQEVDVILTTLRSAPQASDGLEDLMPAALLVCGKVKLLASDLDGAQGCFAESVRWSMSLVEHPLGRFGREHLALVHALNEDFLQAAELLSRSNEQHAHGVSKHFMAAGSVARLLVAVGGLDLQAADVLLRETDASIRESGLGWAVLHAEAGLALARSEPWELIHRINRRLVTDQQRYAPSTLPGSMLRADLTGLYQAASDLRAAERTLRSPELPSSCPHLLLATARQSLLLGRPDQAISIFQRDEASHATITPARFRAGGAVLYASAELAIAGEGDEGAFKAAVSAVAHSGARVALMGASEALRTQIFPTLDVPLEQVPSPWEYRTRIKLTQREREILQALREFGTLKEVAASMHVSINTAKTHVQTLYRKLGAHNRDEALWLGRDQARRS
ncbi:LuxR C-terminal-related transcriptional regulator [Plantibacter sp. CFBP 8804]|uniref:LuxR C-terminal-related transcriptional regulator n=1 Tax=Plantibacter sp. CFBP 8804 TaxID=2775270 RepID=UPI00177F7AD8|nr:LuxR C-terminal-related transcriptional regulator [Plantibacter sp. CFBP 8804]MBD8519032.1 hypothetical protein [Plantibacter sp. CFBP 8804]